MKNKQALILLFTANGISGFAQGISMLAIPWYFAQQNMSGRFNLLYAIVTFLTLFWGLYAGTIVDRYNRKSVFLGTNIVEGLVLFSIAAIGWYLGWLPWYLIMVVFAITIFGYNIHYPNLYAFAQEVTSSKNYKHVTSYIEIVGQSTNVLAGTLAAILLEGVDVNEAFTLFGEEYHLVFSFEPWTIYEIFTLDGSTYVVSVILIAFIKYKPLENLEVEYGNVFKRIKSGFRFLLSHQDVLIFGIFSYTVFVAMLVLLHALMPMYISNHLHEGGGVFGAMEVLYALGALSAGIFARKLFQNFKITLAVILLMFLATAAFLISAATKSVPIFLVVGLLVGFSNAGIRVLRLTYLFDHIPNNIIGRANSVFSLTNVAMRVSFILLFSVHFFTVGSNIIWAFVIMGSFIFLSAIVLISRYRRFTSA